MLPPSFSHSAWAAHPENPSQKLREVLAFPVALEEGSSNCRLGVWLAGASALESPAGSSHPEIRQTKQEQMFAPQLLQPGAAPTSAGCGSQPGKDSSRGGWDEGRGGCL